MPNLDGIDAAKELRKKYGKKMKIFLLTGNVTMRDAKGLEDIVDGVLTKPCSKENLRKCLDGIL